MSQIRAKTSLSLSVTLMKLLGLWYLENSQRQKIYKVFSILFITVFTVNFALGMFFSTLVMFDKRDFTKSINQICNLVQHIALCIKAIDIVLSISEIKKLMGRLDESIFNAYNQEQRKYMIISSKYTRRISNLITGSVGAALFMWSSHPLLEKSRRLPVNLYYFANNDINTTRIFVGYYAYASTCMTIGGFSNAALDGLIAGLMIQGIGQLKILKHSLRNLRTLNEGSSKGQTFHKGHENVIYNAFVHSIKHHKGILRYFGEIQAIFSRGIFTQFAASCIVICLAAFNLTLLTPHDPKFFQIIVYLAAILPQIFVYCWYGTMITYESSELGEAAYLGEWYKNGQKVNVVLRIFMERTKKPVVLTAGNFVDLSLPTFTTIMRRAYSFFAVLKNQQENI